MRTTLMTCVAMTFLFSVTTPAHSSDGEIGLFFDLQGRACSQSIGCQQIQTLYVCALLQGASANGIAAAEYALRIGPDYGPDAEWAFEEEWNPAANIVLGSAVFPPDDEAPIQDRQYRGRGVNVAFPQCQPGEAGMVVLQTIRIYNVACNATELPLQVISHDLASNPFFQCPLFNLCDAPAFTKVCLGTNLTICRNPRPPFAINAFCSTSGRAIVNPQGETSADCEPTAVAETNWSTVKGMYR